MNNIRISAVLIFFIVINGFATNLDTSQPILYKEQGRYFAILNVGWDNAWHNTKNHDAVWLFFKSIPQQGGYKHIKAQKAEVISSFADNVDIAFEYVSDETGIFIYPNSDFRGEIDLTLKVYLDAESFEGVHPRRSILKAYGIEMVYIPEGGFVLGDVDKKAQDYGSFYTPEGEDSFKLPQLTSETQELKVDKLGDLYYDKIEGYEGDQTGMIPSIFPKGVAPFYIMKYEITEGQYSDFLNSLNTVDRTVRDITQSENYSTDGGRIIKTGKGFETPFNNKPCNYTGWEDAMALADWACLRPMTEFEFTKACRGNRDASAGEFPWGTNSKLKVQRLPNADGVLTMVNHWEEAKLSDTTLEYFGGSYYWVMDLSGSLWERVVTIGHPNGRTFIGSHGDGILSDEAKATNTDWPSADENSGGVGYRGGGFYGYERFYHEYNPFSPIAYRPYGSWHGINRSKAYGGRFVRTSIKN